jgi:DNA-binding beta-propeller fold protein YncE
MRRFICLICTVGCLVSATQAKEDKEKTPEREQKSVPVGLIVEHEISGVVLDERINEPVGVAVDNRKNLYFTDAGNNRLVLFDRDLKAVREIGGFGGESNQFNRPGYLAIDNGLTLLVADAGNKRIARYDSELNFVDEISLIDVEDPFKYGEPSGVALTDYGAVWIADGDKNRLVLFDNVGTFDRFVGDFGYSGGQLLHPGKLVVHKDEFFVTDPGNYRVAVYDAFGNFSREIVDEKLEAPVAVAIDKDGRCWVLDESTGMLFLFDEQGELLYLTGPQVAGTLQPLKHPGDIALFNKSRMVIVDSGNNRLLVCSIVFE